LFGVGLALVLAVLAVGYGYWREVLQKGEQPIAEVAGQVIRTDAYARFLAYQYALIEQQMANLAQAATGSDADGQASFAKQQIDILQQQRMSADSIALQSMVEGIILHREAEQRGITLTEEAINTEILAQARLIREGPFAGVIQSAGGEQAPSPSVDEAMNVVRTVLARSGYSITEDEYRELVIEPLVLRERLTEALGADVQTVAPQVHARHILVETEEDANAVKERLDKGEDFAAVAKEVSTDTGTKDQGGDLDWFPRGAMVTEFDEAAFNAEPGTIVGPVKTTYGYHIIEVIEKDDARPLSEENLRTERQKHFNEWLNEQKSSVVYHQTPDKATWVHNYIEHRRANAPTPVPPS